MGAFLIHAATLWSLKEDDMPHIASHVHDADTKPTRGRPKGPAEGHGRINRGEYARFVLIARGSLKEAETQLLLAERLGFMKREVVHELLMLAMRINKLLTGLKRRLRE
jgi:hypothetical protein